MRAAFIGAAFGFAAVALSVLGYVTGVNVAGSPPAVTVLQAGAAPRGADLFAANCAGCHGASAQGAVGPKLAGLVRPWTDTAFADAVLDGRAPDGRTLAAMMPHFRTAGFDGSAPTPAQLTALHAYLKGL